MLRIGRLSDWEGVSQYIVSIPNIVNNDRIVKIKRNVEPTPCASPMYLKHISHTHSVARSPTFCLSRPPANRLEVRTWEGGVVRGTPGILELPGAAEALFPHALPAAALDEGVWAR